MTEEIPNDVAEGNVWPEEPGELGPCPFGEPCTNAAHHELSRQMAEDPAPAVKFGRYRARDWPRSSRGMDPGLFC